jgi:amino acid adenylation domain-containing protein
LISFKLAKQEGRRMNKQAYTSLEKFEDAKKYWLNKLSGELIEMKLFPDFPYSKEKEYETGKHPLTLEKEQMETCICISKNNDLSLYVILLAVLKICTFKNLRQDDIVVSSPTYKLSSQEYNKFVAFRETVRSGMTFRELLQTVQKTVTGGYKNQYYPIRKIIELLKLEEEFSLTRIVLYFENVHHQDYLKEMMEEFENDMAFSFRRKEKELEGLILYNSKRFKKETVERWADSYLRIMSLVLADLNIKIADIDILSETAKQQVLVDFNRSEMVIPINKAIPRLFEEQVERTPGNTAVICEDRELTYRRLNERANRLASALEAKGIGPGSIVGMLADTSTEMVIGIIAVLKSGAAYLPLDPEFPEERQRFMLRSGKAQMLLTKQSIIDNRPELLRDYSPGNCILLEDENNYPGNDTNPGREHQPDDLIYIIYTSGTNGDPRGVPIEHRGVVNYTLWRIKNYRFTQNDVTLQLLSYCFDGFVSNFFTSLLSGGTLVMIPDNKKLDPEYIREEMKTRRITNTSLVPEMYKMLLDTVDGGSLQHMRFVVLAGEKAGKNLIERSLTEHPGITLINEYGPTETSVTAAVNLHLDRYAANVIGKPLTNTAIYILDDVYSILPIGVPGEICISGAGVGRGYLNNETLTAEKFIPDPFNPKWRMYKTGDLGRWLPDGNIEFLGRIDNQVKIRGSRIELEEIEHQLQQHDSVKDAVVQVWEDEAGDKVLCASIVSGSTGAPKAGEISGLREHLAQQLPNYMIPAYFVEVPVIPLTSSGKLDRKKLPRPEFKTDRDKYVPPCSPVELKLTQMWAEVLGIEQELIGIDSNFFHLGGHSLKATMLVLNIHKKFNAKIALGKFFKKPFIRDLAQYVSESSGERHQLIPPVEERDYYEMTAAQRRVYIMQQTGQENISYNLPQTLYIDREIDKNKLGKAFRELIDRHEPLRASFVTLNERPVQRVHKKVPFKMEYNENGGEVKDLVEKFVRPFDLESPPLLRVEIAKITDARYLWIIDMHHIIGDGVSRRILTEEFMKLYMGEEPQPLRVQYKDYAHWLDSDEVKKEIKRQEAYWLEIFKEEPPVLNLPTDFPRPQVRSFEGSVSRFEIEKETVQILKKLAIRNEATMYMLLLAIYNVLLLKLSGDDDIVLGIGTTGRWHSDLQNIMGMFVNTMALRTYPQREMTFKDFLAQIKTRVLGAFENQEYQFDDLVKKVAPRMDKSRNPLFDTAFEMNIIETPDIDTTGWNLSDYKREIKLAKFDMVLNAAENGEKLIFIVEYSTNLFKQATVEKFCRYYRDIALCAAENENIRLKDIKISHDLLIPEKNIPEIKLNF